MLGVAAVALSLLPWKRTKRYELLIGSPKIFWSLFGYGGRELGNETLIKIIPIKIFLFVPQVPTQRRLSGRKFAEKNVVAKKVYISLLTETRASS